MKALLIIFLILLFLLLLLLCPLSVKASYREEFFLKLRYLFITVQLAPPKPKKEKKRRAPPEEEEKNSEPEKKKSALQDIIEERGIKGFLELMRLILSVAAGAFATVVRHLTIQRLSLQMTVVGEDAAETAVRYGQACAVVYPALAFLCANGRCRKREVELRAGFQEAQGQVKFQLEARVKLLFVLGAALKAGYLLLKALIRERLNKNRSETKEIQ